MSALQILYEDNHCLAVAKPAGRLTMGDSTGDRTLLDDAKDYIQRVYRKPGAVYLGVVHRLDRPVSGVVVYARTSKAASRLSAQFRDHQIDKLYWAAVTGAAPERAGLLRHELVKDRATNTVRVVATPSRESQSCELGYRLLSRQGAVSLLEIRPQTGRSHQIRVQLAHAGWSIVGDRKYGSREAFVAGQIALHARSLSFIHPTRQEAVTVVCPPPPTWSRWPTAAAD